MSKRYIQIGKEVMESVAVFSGDDVRFTRLNEIRLKFATTLALADIAKQLERLADTLTTDDGA